MIPGLCVGLDLKSNTTLEDYKSLIKDIKADCFKVNPGFSSKLILDIANFLNKEGIKWIYDGKLGDITHTNKAYADYVFNVLGADGVTLNPYLGLESLAPFIAYEDRYNFILCKSTNQTDFNEIQKGAEKRIIEFAKQNKNVGIVYSSKEENDLAEVSQYLNDSIVLSPGIGKQGGKIPSNAESNILYSVSRSILNAESPINASKDFYYAVHKSRLFNLFKKEGYVRDGQFTLSSGKNSDVYFDLKKIGNDIQLFNLITELLSYNLDADLILGLESGGISLASSIAVKENLSFGFVRKEPKNYATKEIIEAEYLDKSNIIIVDDVVTSGASLLNAIDKIPAKISEVRVIIERGKEARSLLMDKGIKMKSLLKYEESA